MFGSEVTHRSGVRLQIETGAQERSSNHDWFYSRDSIVEVQMTAMQFVELITTGMNGSGVPCTIKRRDGKLVEQKSFAKDVVGIYKDERTENELAVLNRVGESISLVESLEKQKAVSKADLKEVKASLIAAQQMVKNNMPYLTKCFDEHIEKTVQEAKCNIEGFIENKIRTAGLEAIRGDIQQKIASQN